MFLALIGISAGMVVAGGVFSFIVELGVISDLLTVHILQSTSCFMKIWFLLVLYWEICFRFLRSICRDVPYSLGYLDCLEEFLLDAGLWHLQKS